MNALDTITTINTLDAFTARTATLTTTDKKGKVRGFEMSLAYAGASERQRLAMDIMAEQCLSGNYGNLMRAVLEEGILSKGQTEVVTFMLGSVRRPSKETARQFCAMIEAFRSKAVDNGKPPKGKKLGLINMVGQLSAIIGKSDAPKGDIIDITSKELTTLG